VVDNQHLDRALGGFQLQAQLFLNRGEDVGTIGVDGKRLAVERQMEAVREERLQPPSLASCSWASRTVAAPRLQRTDSISSSALNRRYYDQKRMPAN
jgi:hypothetical protein